MVFPIIQFRPGEQQQKTLKIARKGMCILVILVAYPGTIEGIAIITILAGGFKHFIFSTLPGEMIQFD